MYIRIGVKNKNKESIDGNSYNFLKKIKLRLMNRSAKELLMSASEDWIPEVKVVDVIKELDKATSKDDVRKKSLALVKKLIQDDLMEIGDLRGDLIGRPGFRKWDNPLKDILLKLENEWRNLGEPSLSDLFWLSNTKKGNEIGRYFLEKQQKIENK